MSTEWKLVPVESTEEMDGIINQGCEGLWADVLAAAPEHPQLVTLQRYLLDFQLGCLEPDETGEWVKFYDVQAMLAVAPQPPALGVELKLIGEYHADVDMLLAEKERMLQTAVMYQKLYSEVSAERDTLKAELTKARELIEQEAASYQAHADDVTIAKHNRDWYQAQADRLRAHQSAPAAKDGAQ